MNTEKPKNFRKIAAKGLVGQKGDRGLPGFSGLDGFPGPKGKQYFIYEFCI